MKIEVSNRELLFILQGLDKLAHRRDNSSILSLSQRLRKKWEDETKISASMRRRLEVQRSINERAAQWEKERDELSD